MRERRVTLPEIVLIAATRAMIGFGAGLLISDRLPRDRRKAAGWTLLAVGALSTIPLALRLFRRRGTEALAAQDVPPPLVTQFSAIEMMVE